MVFFHGWDDSLFDKIKQNFFHTWILSTILNKTSKILVLSKEYKHKLTALGIDNSKIELTKVMVNSTDFGNAKKSDLDNPKFLFCGALLKEKGIFEMIYSYKQILNHFPSSVLQIMGDGPERNRLETLVKRLNLSDNVSFLGL